MEAYKTIRFTLQKVVSKPAAGYGLMVLNEDNGLTVLLKNACPKCLLLILLLMMPYSVIAEEPAFHFKCETILSGFERENDKGESQQVIPVYEYMQMDYGQLESEGLSLHLHGWLRTHLGDADYFDEDVDGELLYGYVEYLPSSNSFNLKIGRQHLFSGIINDSFDGVGVQGMLSPYTAVELFGGVPTSLDEENGRSGDTAFGGRSALFLGKLNEIGLSYKRITDDDETDENSIGIDTSLGFSTRVTMHGISSWNIETQEWREHTYEAALALDPLLLKPLYQAYRFEDYFSEDGTGLQPFGYLQETGEKLVVLGGDAIWLQNPGFDAGIRLKQYDYELRDETSQYRALILNFYGNAPTRYGLEGGIMEGESSENRYKLGRGYLFWGAPFGTDESWYMSSDMLFVHYDEDIYGKDHSWFVSLGGGKRLLDGALQLEISGDYGSDPYFDEDARITVILKYDY